jgi:hypothetical protein
MSSLTPQKIKEARQALAAVYILQDCTGSRPISRRGRASLVGFLEQVCGLAITPQVAMAIRAKYQELDSTTRYVSVRWRRDVNELIDESNLIEASSS